MERQEVKSRLESRFQSAVNDNSELHSAYLLVHSDSRDLHWNLATGQTEGIEADPEQPFYAASIGKTFTSTIVAILADYGQLSFDDSISEYLSESLLDGLHTINGTDYTDDIRIHHLLSHTSGLPHSLPEGGKMFLNTRLEESPEGKTLFDEMLEEPDRIWEPEETIEWAKQNLEPHFPPGEDCYYSEFGYNLLGLIIESVTEQPYHEALEEFLFDPLEMEHSYLPPFSVLLSKVSFPRPRFTSTRRRSMWMTCPR